MAENHGNSSPCLPNNWNALKFGMPAQDIQDQLKRGFVTPRAIFNGEKLWKRAAFCRNFLPNWFRVRFWSSRCVRNGPKPWHSSSRMNSRLWGSWSLQNRVIIAQVMVKNASRCNQFIVRFEAKRRFLVYFGQINGGWSPAQPVYFCLKSSSGISATVSPEVLD